MLILFRDIRVEIYKTVVACGFDVVLLAITTGTFSTLSFVLVQEFSRGGGEDSIVSSIYASPVYSTSKFFVLSANAVDVSVNGYTYNRAFSWRTQPNFLKDLLQRKCV